MGINCKPQLVIAGFLVAINSMVYHLRWFPLRRQKSILVWEDGWMECWTQLLSSYHPGKIHQYPEIPTNPKVCLNLMLFLCCQGGIWTPLEGPVLLAAPFDLVLSGDRRMSKRTGKDHLFWGQIQPRWHEHLDFDFFFKCQVYTP